MASRNENPPRLSNAGTWRSRRRVPGNKDLLVSYQWVKQRDGSQAVKTFVVEARGNEEITARQLASLRFAAMAAGLQMTWTKATQPPGPKGWPRSHYERLAADYRRALVERPSAPTQSLADGWQVSPATVRAWLRRAHELGLLPERTSRPGRRPRQEGKAMSKRPMSAKGGTKK